MRSKKKCENVVTDVKKGNISLSVFLNHELDDVHFIKYEHISFLSMQFEYRIDVHLFLCPHPRVCLC
jgi:hypothetical protein